MKVSILQPVLALTPEPRLLTTDRLITKVRVLDSCKPQDIRAVVKPVLRHRIIVNFSAEAEGVNSDTVIDKLIETIPQTESEISSDGRLSKVLGSEDA